MEMISEWKSQKVEQYLQENFRPYTRNLYRSHIKMFFKFLDVDADTYFDAGRDYKKDVLSYNKYLQENNYAPKSISVKLSTIRNYLEAKKVDFGARFWKQVAKRGLGTAPILKDRSPTVKELRQILTLATAKERAFFLVMATGGIREAELVQLKVKDFDFDSSPVKITIPGTIAKNKQERFTFITPEAKNAVMAWMKRRENYINKSMEGFKGLEKYLKNKYKKVEIGSPDRIFPFTEDRARKWWNKLLDDAGLNEIDTSGKTNDVHVLRLYTLRKFFNTRLKKVIPEFVVKTFMGHEGYLNGSYDRFTGEELKQWYAKGMDQLYILEAPANQEAVEGIKEQMERLKEQVAELLKQTPMYHQMTEEVVTTGVKAPDKVDEKHPDKIVPIKEAVKVRTDKEAYDDFQKIWKTQEEMEKVGDLDLWAKRKRIEQKKKQARKE
jgi:integrase